METCNVCVKTKIDKLFTWGKDPVTGKERKIRCRDCTQKKIAASKEILKERLQKIAKRYRNKNREKRERYNKKWLTEHPELYAAWKEKYRERRNEYEKNKLRDPMFKLNHYISTRIHSAVKGGQRWIHWESMVGYTLDQLKKQLESQFQDGMTWENYGQWHIDHKIPRAAFNYKTPKDIDFKRCWALKNLQPLWELDNIKKGAKLEKPFQPALAI
jgi:nucleoid DNA-binding protein